MAQNTESESEKMIRYLEEEKVRSSNKHLGCGCMTLLVAIVLCVVFPLLGVPLFLIGLILVIMAMLKA